eukprot:CAMPEP_0174259320 /NCGR_PEP_ID=MMETSP0439-20130205/8161_1 /TAXON_ID=0 /ORGANISM="Stereomyxa ramosa, Strain Chinc5" /LENGTH=365 /DNA_ID=CAMNT_0015343151 /DNA_START=394 /DNA_END=1488 /DNA_ORIENTATION=-
MKDVSFPIPLQPQDSFGDTLFKQVVSGIRKFKEGKLAVAKEAEIRDTFGEDPAVYYRKLATIFPNTLYFDQRNPYEHYLSNKRKPYWTEVFPLEEHEEEQLEEREEDDKLPRAYIRLPTKKERKVVQEQVKERQELWKKEFRNETIEYVQGKLKAHGLLPEGEVVTSTVCFPTENKTEPREDVDEDEDDDDMNSLEANDPLSYLQEEQLQYNAVPLPSQYRRSPAVEFITTRILDPDKAMGKGNSRTLYERKVIMNVHLPSLGLRRPVLERLEALLGPRYNPETKVAKITSDKHPSKQENRLYLKYLFGELINNAMLAETYYAPLEDLEVEDPTSLIPPASLPSNIEVDFKRALRDDEGSSTFTW